jgi:putative membrane protein
MSFLPLSSLPTVNAVLNSASAVFLLLGFVFIRRGRVQAHKTCMLSAFSCSVVFLISYIYYHVHAGIHRFPSHGWIRPVYMTILTSHTILAVMILPLILITLYRALKSDFIRHRKIAIWTWPLWLYVSVTGVVVYWLLYHAYAS